jgi:hypothetical protein
VALWVGNLVGETVEVCSQGYRFKAASPCSTHSTSHS